jgi:hypothetical protein
MIPAREPLRAAYDAVIEEIDSVRGSQQLTNAFYAKIGDAVFEAGYSALEHSQAAQEATNLPPRLNVVSAPMGTGKTSFTIAFIAALVRLTEADTQARYGCVFVVEQMAKADEMFQALQAMIPGKAAVWTTDHDIKCAKPAKVLNPSARFHVDDLQNHTVAVVTHSFYKGPRGHKARNVISGDVSIPRALTVIDEQPDDVDIFDVTVDGATAVLKAVKRDEEENEVVTPHLQKLVKFMTDKTLVAGASLEKATDDPRAWRVAADLGWFNTKVARDYARDRGIAIPGLAAVVGLARAMANGYAFIARYGGDVPHFVGYENKFDPAPGMLLLDATADIDGITQLCPWRSHVQVPQASYANLSIVHVKSCTTQRVSKFLKLAKNRYEYVNWMKHTSLPTQNQDSGCWSSALRHFLTIEMCRTGLSVTNASIRPTCTCGNTVGTLRAVSSVRPIGAASVSAPIHGRTLMWFSCSTSSMCHVG